MQSIPQHKMKWKKYIFGLKHKRIQNLCWSYFDDASGTLEAFDWACDLAVVVLCRHGFAEEFFATHTALHKAIIKMLERHYVAIGCATNSLNLQLWPRTKLDVSVVLVTTNSMNRTSFTWQRIWIVRDVKACLQMDRQHLFETLGVGGGNSSLQRDCLTV